MAIYNLSAQSLKSIFIIAISLFMLAQNAESISFTFPHFGSKTYGLTFQGDAFASNGSIQVRKTRKYGVPLPKSAGRASYAASVRLWDAKTGKLIGFTTSFTFIVAPNGPKGLLGDGISFFITPFQYKIPKNSNGGFLGLFNAKTSLNAYKNQIVAVEFDSFSSNPWDPNTTHIGIDVNSIASAKTTQWKISNVGNGFTALATINYEPVSKTLRVCLVGG